MPFAPRSWAKSSPSPHFSPLYVTEPPPSIIAAGQTIDTPHRSPGTASGMVLTAGSRRRILEQMLNSVDLERRGSRGELTRARLLQAAIETLASAGYAGTTVRAIASAAGVNQALVFYHYGSVVNLLVAALNETSRRRMNRYEPLLGAVADLAGLAELAGRIYREDVRSGESSVLAEMIAGSSVDSELAREVTAALEPWIEMVRRTLRRVMAPSMDGERGPLDDAAYAVVALFLGMEMLAHLDDANARRADSLFASLVRATSLLAGVGVAPAREPSAAGEPSGAGSP